MKDYTLTKGGAAVLWNNMSSLHEPLKPEMNEQTCVLFTTVFNSGLIGVLCVLGLAGNIMSLTILHTDRQNRVASFLLQALAVADTAVLIISSFVLVFIYGILHSQTTVMAQKWVQFIHKYVNSLGYSAQGVTIWFTVLLAINRYVAVCRPLHANRLTIRGAQIQTCSVVIISIVSNIPRIFLFDLTRGPSHPPPPLSTTITSDRPTNQTEGQDDEQSPPLMPVEATTSTFSVMVFEVVYTTFILILPLLLLAGLNVRLIRELQGAKRRLRHFSRSYSGSNEDNITVVMLAVIVVVVICHTPDRIAQILRWLPMYTSHSRRCPNWMYFFVSVSNLLIVLNSSINFLIYCVFRKRFRRILVLKICHGRRNRPVTCVGVGVGGGGGGGVTLSSRSIRSRYSMARGSDAIELKDEEGGAEKRGNSSSFAMQSVSSGKQAHGSPTSYSLLY